MAYKKELDEALDIAIDQVRDVAEDLIEDVDMQHHVEAGTTLKPTEVVLEINAILEHLGQSHLKEIYEEHRRRYPGVVGANVRYKDEKCRQSAIRIKLQNHCRNSKQYRKSCPPLFENPARGIWRLALPTEDAVN
jgi:hypothetical protein